MAEAWDPAAELGAQALSEGRAKSSDGVKRCRVCQEPLPPHFRKVHTGRCRTIWKSALRHRSRLRRR
jgi:hypothetical protein